VRGRQIVDRDGRAFLIRGTRLSEVTGGRSDLDGSDGAFGPLSATTLITIRMRLNMNAVRLPVRRERYLREARYRDQVTRIAALANDLQLLVILTADGASPEFWAECARAFRDRPNVFFAAGSAELVKAIRGAGAAQPVVVPMGSEDASDPDLIYEVRPRAWGAAERSVVSERVPVLVDGLDPRLNEDAPECRAFPRDPAEASDLVNSGLAWLDAHEVSWTLASFRPGSLIGNYRYFAGTKLDDGWDCGATPSAAGLGLVLLAHLWKTEPHALFPVHADAGGMLLPRGGIVTMYGPILADRTETAARGSLPMRLANVRVRVTDALGATRTARLITTGAGWSEMSFLVPGECAPGPADVRLLRDDGSGEAARVRIADVAPGIASATNEGRGPARGTAFLRDDAGAVREMKTWACAGPYDCRAVPIPLARGVRATLRLDGSGFRHAAPSDIAVRTGGGERLRVISIHPMTGFPGRDAVTVEIPETLIGRGEADVWASAGDVLSDVVRVNFGAAPPAPPQPATHGSGPRALLGRYLFYDRRMSVNGKASCATCHRQELAFTDGRAHAVGATGQEHPRSAMSLVNVAYSRQLNWSDPTVHSLEEQALKPMWGSDPVELGLDAIEPRFLRMLRTDAVYRPLFPRAFPGEANPYTVRNAARAIAAFERTIVSADSPWDRFHYGDASAISESAKRGEILFFSYATACFRCHGGFNFSTEDGYHNTALYDPYPPPNLGLFTHTKRAADIGKFKAPTLRNIAVTAPYMHDGSIGTLEEVLEHYAAGGRAHGNPGRDPLIRGFYLTAQNRADLVEFLKSLTDEGLLHDPRFRDPTEPRP
jgi:cytochrome c peroxidase